MERIYVVVKSNLIFKSFEEKEAAITYAKEHGITHYFVGKPASSLNELQNNIRNNNIPFSFISKEEIE